MTRDEAIRTEVRRMAQAAASGQTHLAHIRHLAVLRLRGHGFVPYDAEYLADRSASYRMLGDDHPTRTADLVAA